MKLGRTCKRGLALSWTALALLTACNRRKPAEINPIEPAVSFNRSRVPLGSAVEATYTWKLDPAAKTPTGDYQAMVHVLDSHKQILFSADHRPVPPPQEWKPGQTYTYSRTVFVPLYSYVGPAQVRMGLYNGTGRGERVALKGNDQGMSEILVGQLELLPQTENIFLLEKEGWHAPETSANARGEERTWTKKEALLQFKNPKKDVIFYLEADTNFKAFPQPPVLTIAVNGGTSGVQVPIPDSEVFLKKVRFKAQDLGTGEWVDLRLSMNQAFLPKAMGLNNDERELGLLVYHHYAGLAEQLGAVAGVVDAGPLTPPPPVPVPVVAKAGAVTAKPATAAKTASPAPKKP